MRSPHNGNAREGDFAAWVGRRGSGGGTDVSVSMRFLPFKCGIRSRVLARWDAMEAKLEDAAVVEHHGGLETHPPHPAAIQLVVDGDCCHALGLCYTQGSRAPQL